MTPRHDPERLIKAFLEGGPSELPDRSFDAVRAAINEERQWVVIGPWREHQMTKYAKFAVAAAAVVLVAVVGFRFLPSSGGVGSEPTSVQTPSPAITMPPTLQPQPTTAQPTAGSLRLPVVAGAPKSLQAGTYFTPEASELAVSVTVPAGWYGAAGRSGFSVGQGLNEAEQRYADAGLHLSVIELEYNAAVAAFDQLQGVEFTSPMRVTTLDAHEATVFHANPIGDQVVLNGIDPGADLTFAADRQIFVDVDGQTVLIRTELFGSAAEAALTAVIDSIRFP